MSCFLNSVPSRLYSEPRARSCGKTYQRNVFTIDTKRRPRTLQSMDNVLYVDHIVRTDLMFYRRLG